MRAARSGILAIATLILLAGSSNAQVGGGGGTQMLCSVTASATPYLRSESLTELVGDIVISCTGGSNIPEGAAITPVNITASFTSQVTSRLFADGTSEALLLIDEPNTGLPKIGRAHV